MAVELRARWAERAGEPGSAVGGLDFEYARAMSMRLESIAAVDVTGRRATDRAPAERLVKRAILRILDGNVLCAIATVSPRGRAHVNTAYFAWSDPLLLFFLSHPDSRHCRNLRERPTMAISVFDSRQKWGGPDRGLQLFGTCRETRGASSARAEEVYAGRFKGYWKWREEEWPEDAEWELRFYQFTTLRLKLFDETEFPEAPWVTASLGTE